MTRFYTFKSKIFIFFFCIYLISFSLKSQNSQWEHFYKNNNLTTVAVEHDTVWVGTLIGLYQFLETGELLNIYSQFNSPLKNTRIEDIKIDENGTKWIATDGLGLFRFDGSTWKNYNTFNSNIAANRLLSIAIQSTDTIWVSGYGTISCLKRGVWENFNQDSTPLLRPGYGIQLAIDKNQVKWLLQGIDLIRFDNTSWNRVDLNEKGVSRDVQLILADESPEKNIWIGTKNGLTKITDADRWFVYKTFNSQLPSDYVQDLFAYQDSLYILTDKGVAGLNVMLASSRPELLMDFQKLGISETIQNFGVDNTGKIWLGPYSKIMRGVKQDSTVILDSLSITNSKIPHNQIMAVMEDKSGNHWFGAYYYGIGVEKDGNWTYYNRDNSPLPRGNVLALAQDSLGKVWIGTTEGLFIFNGQNIEPFPPFEHMGITDIEIDSRNIPWVGTYEGLFTLKNGIWIKYQRDYSGDFFGLSVSKIVLDGDSAVWVMHGDGISKLKLPEYQWTNWKNPELGTTYLRSMVLKEAGVVWVGLDSKGILEFDGINKKFYTPGNSGLSGYDVWVTEKDSKGTIWIGTEQGLCSYNGTRWQTWDATNAPLIKLPNNTRLMDNPGVAEVVYLWIDRSDNIWMIQNVGHGIFKFRTNLATHIDNIMSSTKTSFFQVYPNPNNGSFFIKNLHSTPKEVIIQIFDSTGKQVFVTKKATEVVSIVLPSLPKGIYFVKLSSDSNFEVKKLVLR